MLSESELTRLILEWGTRRFPGRVHFIITNNRKHTYAIIFGDEDRWAAVHKVLEWVYNRRMRLKPDAALFLIQCIFSEQPD